MREGVITTVRRLTKDHFRLYDLIFRRFIASQMKPAVVLKQKVVFRVDEKEVEIEGVTNVAAKVFE